MNTAAVSFAIRALIGIVAYFGIKLKEDEVAVCIKLLGKTQSERYVKCATGKKRQNHWWIPYD